MTGESIITLHPKQMEALTTKATEVLYGGSAGGGKSHLMRAAAISWAYDIAGLQIYLFRRSFPDLARNHIHGPSGLLEMLGPYLQAKYVNYNASKNLIQFWNGSVIHLSHLNSRADLINYQGAEIHVLMPDELTQFDEDEYRYLRGRVRLGGLQIPERWKGFFPRVLASANPGGIGHAWVKRTFIEPALPGEIWQAPDSEGGMLRQYIPARLADNPSMEKDYARRLQGLGSPEMVRAWLEGDWEAVSGAALEQLSKKVHAVRRFDVPRHWTRFTSMDWGTAKPFSVGWYAVAEGGTVVRGKDGAADVYIPDGAVVRYREWYGWNGKPDTGCRMESFQVAEQVLEMERQWDEPRIDYRVGDSAMWAQSDGPSPQERMYKHTNGRFMMQQAVKDRAMNYQEFRARLATDEDGHPMFFCMDDCTHFWRTVPNLQLDQLNPEKGPDGHQEDHVYDEVSYALRSRPFKTSASTRQENEFKRLMREAKKMGAKENRI